MKDFTKKLLLLATLFITSITLSAQTPMSGSYSVDLSGSGNFSTMLAAATALAQNGVNGPVTINIKDGTYGRFTIDSIPGTSSANTVTFQSHPSNTNQAIIEDSATTSIDNYLVYLNGCDNTVFKNLTFNALGVNFGTVFLGNSTLTNWTLDGNTMNGSAGTSASNFNHAMNNGTSSSKGRGSFHFINNNINNFSVGIQMGGTGYQLGADSIFMDNNIIYATDQGINFNWVKYVEITNNDMYRSVPMGLWWQNMNNTVNYISFGLVFNNNKVRGSENALNAYTNATNQGFPLFAEIKNNDIETGYRGIYLRGNPDSLSGNTFRDVVIENNKITDVGNDPVNGSGIELVNINIDLAKNGLVQNNMISMGNPSNTTSWYSAIKVYHSANLDIIHNTLHLRGGSPLWRGAIHLDASASTTQFTPTGNEIHNNIFTNYGSGSAIHAEAIAVPGTFFTSDYNIYFGNSTTALAYGALGVGTNTISGWNTLSGGQDSNSFFGDPIYVSANDIHTAGTLADSAGTPLGLATDFDGDTRSLTNPDIGADEYTPLSCFGVTSLSASNVTANSADLSWSSYNSGALGYEIRYNNQGSVNYNFVSGTGTSKTLNGLSSGTVYNAQVREICSVGDTSVWSDIVNFGTELCDPISRCAHEFIMTDAFGDGWNGGTISVEQKNALNGQWIEMGEASLASGAGPVSVFGQLCDGDSARLVCKAPGSFFYEMGFTLFSATGDTIYTETGSSSNDGTTASAGQVFATFLVSCPATCPITDSVNVPSETTCGPSEVTFNTSNTNPANTVLWMNSSSEVLSSGNSFTTPIITANTDYYASVFTANNLVAPHTFGPATTLTGGFGNYTNGMWFSASKAFVLDSISVISNGLVDFQVRISEGGGSKASGHSGNELQLSDTINVPAAGTHQVYVGLAITPGTYYINFDFVSGTPGQLHRATSGGTYPYTVANVASIDSVQFGSTNSRVYYAYDWVITEGCTGPVTTASAIYGNVPSTALPYLEDFNNGLSCAWSVLDPGGSTWEIIDNYQTSSNLNGTKFAFVDDDGAGSTAPATNVKLVSPVFNAVGYDTLTVEFDHYWRPFTGSAGYVEVYDGSAWVQVAAYTTATIGAWSNPSHETIDVTAYQNADFQIRFRYDDQGGNWGWFWAVDNVELDGALAPCTDVRVEVLTDVYGDEISWEIIDVNTGNVMASRGPLNYVFPFNASASTYVDTVCLPDAGTYEFRIEDSYGDGMNNPVGYYTVDILCPWGLNNVAKLDTSNGGAFNHGGTVAAGFTGGSWDSTVFTINCIQTSEVTFQVNMNKVTSAFTTPELNGTFNNWCGNCDAMSDADGDNIWDVSITLPVGDTVEFKYSADGWTIQETLSNQGSCVIQSGQFVNRILTIPAADTTLPVVCWGECDDCVIDVTLNVNMAWEVANGAIDTNGIHVAGTWQNWDPMASEMLDPDGDGIYSITFGSATGESLQYKFINGIDWAGVEASGDLSPCGVSDGLGGYNRLSALGSADTVFAAVCFSKCYDCAVSIDEALGSISLYPNPTAGAFTLGRTNLSGEIEVSIIGLQGQLLQATKWDDGSSDLRIDLSDLASGVYMVRLTAEEGTRTMRVAVQR